MSFRWYQVIHASDDITQGDIIDTCSIPVPTASLYRDILASKEIAEDYLEFHEANLVILSQACDLEHGKIDSVVLSPVWPLKMLTENNSYYRGNNARESLRQGKEPAYHLLNSFDSEEISMDYSIVDFHQIYTLPKTYLKSIAESKSARLRLLPPYREHLSQAFARYFMRVGLPLDIDKTAIKQYPAIYK